MFIIYTFFKYTFVRTPGRGAAEAVDYSCCQPDSLASGLGFPRISRWVNRTVCRRSGEILVLGTHCPCVRGRVAGEGACQRHPPLCCRLGGRACRYGHACCGFVSAESQGQSCRSPGCHGDVCAVCLAS